MKIAAVVPMKLNNQRLPQKNIKSFTNGDPLCTYILNTLKTIELIDHTYVYCSDDSICKYLPEDIVFQKRRKEFDSETTKMNEILKAFAQEVDADVYVMTHTTAPFIKASSIEKGIRAVSGGKYDSAFAVKPLQDFIWKDGKPFNYDIENIPRTQDLEPLYMETSGFYIYRREVILTQCSRIGRQPKMVEVDEMEAIDIDEWEDFMMADAVFNYKNVCSGGGANKKIDMPFFREAA